MNSIFDGQTVGGTRSLESLYDLRLVRLDPDLPDVLKSDDGALLRWAQASELLSLVLQAHQAPHVLAQARILPIAPNFLYALIQVFKGEAPAGSFAEFLSCKQYLLPIGPLQRAALRALASDLLWEIEQPQAS
jgi:hypothetical protein